jgi:glycosyltransferase involved in cell wall biosynthesis
MIQNKKPRVSIVIPVYNEADQLDVCLQAIARQTVKPVEVLVVDNNSTDDTVSVASRYGFVTLLHESLQGVVYARNRGFNAALGDVIGRIDADTTLPPDWVATLSDLFADQTVDAVSGSVSYYDIALPRAVARVDLFFRQQIARGMGEEVFLYGANMALRRTSWLKARDSICLKGGVHEDYDLAIHLEDARERVVFDGRLRASTTLRRFDMESRAFWYYVWLQPHTYAIHGRKSQRHMYPAMILLSVFYWLLKALHRGYDVEAMRFSWQKLLDPAVPARVNPATFVD